MDILHKINEFIENSKFCYAKVGGQGYVDKKDCTCKEDRNCQAYLDRMKFLSYFKDIPYEEIPKHRNRILNEIKEEFKDSQWFKDNVKQ